MVCGVPVSCSVVAQRQESPSNMRFVYRRARVNAEAGKPLRQSLVHNDARPASRARDGVEAGELQGMRSM